jgi:UTP--glucose-1-phosphate uridylyltransferase
MPSVTKLIIPVAGLGTRFLPATKAQPKEMLPVVDKPIIQYVVEGAVASGIRDIILVTGPNKRAIEDHFSPNYELISWLKKQGKDDMAEQVKSIADMANFVFIRQKGPYGNGTPVLCAKDLVGDEPFAVMWGDEFFYSPKKPHLKQLMDVLDQHHGPVLTAYEVDDEGTEKYGIINPLTISTTNKMMEVKNIVEKPGPKKAPSRLTSLGGFILTPDIFPELEKTKLGKGGELWLVDALFKLLQKRSIFACKVAGEYYDTGSKLGYLKANVDFALRDEKLRKDFRKYLQGVV